MACLESRSSTNSKNMVQDSDKTQNYQAGPVSDMTGTILLSQHLHTVYIE